jgi:hypothetical protein
MNALIKRLGGAHYGAAAFFHQQKYRRDGDFGEVV